MMSSGEFSRKIASSQTSNITLTLPLFLYFVSIPVSQRKFEIGNFPTFPVSARSNLLVVIVPSQKQPAENSNFLIYLIFGCSGFGAVSGTLHGGTRITSGDSRGVENRKPKYLKASYAGYST